MRATTAAIVLAGLVFGLGGAAQAGKAEAEARKHARKANQLADVNKCWSAIGEYDKALRALKDASLLFNRGECYRKTGQTDKAIADYKKFLVELPAAPNRAQVEAQIATLQKGAAVAAPAPAPVPSPSSSLRLPPKATHALPNADSPAEKPKQKDKPAEAELVMPPPDFGSETPPAVPPAPAAAPVALAEPSQPGLLDQGTALRPVDAEPKSGGHVWVWVVVGLLVLGGAAAGTYVVMNPAKTDTSGGALGNYRF